MNKSVLFENCIFKMKYIPKVNASKEVKNLTFVCRKPNIIIDFLLGTYGSSATKLKKLASVGAILVNEQVVKDIKKNIGEGDVVVIRMGTVDSSNSSVSIVYEDAWLIVVNKPAGLLTVTDGNGGENLFQQLKKEQSGEVFICHRLDREVSGLLIFTKTKEAQEIIEENWSAFQKTYFARVEGEVKIQTAILTNYLKIEGPTLVRVVKDEAEGVKAITEYSVLNKSKQFSDLEIMLHTGKKNQIRIQLAHMGHPIVGDKKFGSITRMQNRIALHSWKLQCKHPINNTDLQFEAPLPF